MNTDYKVGELIYDANIYDGLNTFLSDVHFTKGGYRKAVMLKYLNFAAVQVDSIQYVVESKKCLVR